MDHREIVRRTVETLRDVLRESGHGAIKQTEDHLGVSSGYLRWARARGVLRLGHLAKILSFLGVSPGLFFRRAFPIREDDAVTELLLEARAIAGRLGEPRTLVDLRVEHLAESAERASGCSDELDPALAEELERLDDLRYDGVPQAQEAAREAEKLAWAHRDRPASAARALGVWASALRFLTRLDDATVVLALAIEIARRGRLRTTLGDLLQRASFVVFDRGELDRALTLNAAALVLHAEHDDPSAMARILVDRGSHYANMREPEAAIRAYESGSRQLPSDAIRYRAAALQGLACAYYDVGRLELAEEYAVRAAEIMPDRALLTGRLSWVRARIATGLGDLAQAERHYDETLEALRDQTYDAVLVATEWVRVLLLQNRSREASKWARQLTWLEGAAGSNKIVHAALTDMIRCAWIGRLELETVDRIIRRIEGGHARTHARRRAVSPSAPLRSSLPAG